MTNIQDTIFLFLDDVRNPPSDHWLVSRTAEEMYGSIIGIAKLGMPMVVSLDHDLGEDMSTGYDLLNWLEKDVVTDQNFRPNISFQIHSANPVGRANMKQAIQSIMRYLDSE